MKSQDVFLLLKLVSLDHQERGIPAFLEGKWDKWTDWEDPEPHIKPRANLMDLESKDYLKADKTIQDSIAAQYSVRALADATGISKSEVSLSLQRSYEVGLAKPDRITKIPRVNQQILADFIIFGIRFVFPAKAAEITRGIATAFAAPALKSIVKSAGEIVPVWPDARGATTGQAVLPLFKTVPFAVRQDARLYELLALVDAIRIGQPRERKLASMKFSQILKDE